MYNINISNRRTYSLNNNSNKSNNSTGTGSRNKKSIKTSLKNNKSNSKRSILSRHSIISNYKNKIIDSFILFGCWNNIDCSSKYWKNNPIYRDIIINKIKKEKEKLVIVAGDNWYSQNFKYDGYVYKYYPYDILTTGYSLLFNNTNKEFDIILGNHDENNDKIIGCDNPYLKKDCMLKTQKYTIYKIANNIPIINTPSLEELLNIDNKNLTINNINFFTCIDKPVIKELKKGVYILYINTNLFDNFTYKVREQGKSNSITTRIMLSYVNHIEKILKIYNPKLLFVVGHNPLIAYKKKEFHKLSRIYDDADNSYIMEMFVKILNNYKTLYLCADVHNFNIALLNKNLGTIISGTGGGDPDIENIEGKVNYFLSPNDNLFNITNHYVYNAYGYTKIKYDKYLNVHVTYKQLFNAYKDIKMENKIIEKTINTYNFVFRNTADGWDLIKKNNRISENKIILNIPKLIDYKIKLCNKIVSNNKKNITALSSQFVKSNKYKYNYLEDDKNTPLLCFYKKKKIKNK